MSYVARWPCDHDFDVMLDTSISRHGRTLGIEDKDLLIARPRSGVLKPSYFLLYDHRMKSVVLLVRGTQSVKVRFE